MYHRGQTPKPAADLLPVPSPKDILSRTTSPTPARTYHPKGRQHSRYLKFKSAMGTLLIFIAVMGLVLLLSGVETGGTGIKQQALKDACPSYGDYANRRHGPFSEGPLKLPSQRPIPACRTFVSKSVEELVASISKKMVDKDLARLFENCFPNTLDTTIKYHNPKSNPPQSFIITGDINAEWLRDSTNQLAPYVSLLRSDRALRTLFAGAIHTQADMIRQYSYCNAFHPPPAAGLKRTYNDQHDVVHPPYDPAVVFECKWELDSLAAFIKLSWMYYTETGDTKFMDKTWTEAVQHLFGVLNQQSEPTFDDMGRPMRNAYTFRRQTTSGTETLALSGAGHPINGNTSLIRSAFRPSDDATIFQYFIPANAMMSVELGHLSEMLKKANHDGTTWNYLSSEAARISAEIRAGIYELAVIDHKIFGSVLAYEVDGYGGALLMDDANIPSLLSLPMLGFVDMDDPIYQNTRRMVLSSTGNPYFLGRPSHTIFSGIGGPHIGTRHAWPMSVIVQILTETNETEIVRLLEMLKKSTAGLGLMHESVNVERLGDFTRPWFAWVNGLFGQMVLELVEKRPHLIFGDAEAAAAREAVTVEE
ncbi:hypothetical protein SAICODRAFT_6734 [Saitoella complicata NRRL Y-17804]|uniref:Glycoside hydrolase family 125 protein n=1 Tax=Saitoella complicata (strain BCRC 22490 / CBS 7301 / JCM 7358 / NBRC 10748 / NRRL Y-17804) TaxID=698492 RepID=A0A0E9NAI8_SAICN|nr:uncharacterized protein SAICODRAFT_6734 [Saitoella complicata NRRL Y-17804]ODQ53953.1 hypothetical protein SAICODRAFT_6734 [Saitoella complicata NRRL Y-17804]GAO46828.1 hypothetical protein G7K_1046-t1 [Saitoella complicata NRRL Y-17804]